MKYNVALNGFVSLLLFLVSFSQSVDNHEKKSSEYRLDTLKREYFYSPNVLREIVYYRNNKPFKNVGFNEKGDSLTNPAVILPPGSDSFFVFIPVNKFRKSALYIGFDSLRAVRGMPPKISIKNLSASTFIKIRPEMYEKKDTIEGALKFADPDGTFSYYPFRLCTK